MDKIFHIPVTKHAGNCHYSETTGNIEKPLVCKSESGKKQYGKKAGGDDCAKTCTAFKVLDYFSTACLKN